MKKAVSLDGQGHLIIQTSREGDKIIDGCVRTKGKFAHSFGYYEARVKLPDEFIVDHVRVYDLADQSAAQAR